MRQLRSIIKRPRIVQIGTGEIPLKLHDPPRLQSNAAADNVLVGHELFEELDVILPGCTLVKLHKMGRRQRNRHSSSEAIKLILQVVRKLSCVGILFNVSLRVHVSGRSVHTSNDHDNNQNGLHYYDRDSGLRTRESSSEFAGTLAHNSAILVQLHILPRLDLGTCFLQRCAIRTGCTFLPRRSPLRPIFCNTPIHTCCGNCSSSLRFLFGLDQHPLLQNKRPQEYREQRDIDCKRSETRMQTEGLKRGHLHERPNEKSSHAHQCAHSCSAVDAVQAAYHTLMKR
mmetsp:Transcript_201/g.440  ORF Transcript_201/g.440 Transcript_201/m.440 type:complete len:285 (-) Transcript_201:3269-4123(-)